MIKEIDKMTDKELMSKLEVEIKEIIKTGNTELAILCLEIFEKYSKSSDDKNNH